MTTITDKDGKQISLADYCKQLTAKGVSIPSAWQRELDATAPKVTKPAKGKKGGAE